MDELNLNITFALLKKMLVRGLGLSQQAKRTRPGRSRIWPFFGSVATLPVLATLAFPSHREPQSSKIYCHFIPIPHSGAMLP